MDNLKKEQNHDEINVNNNLVSGSKIFINHCETATGSDNKTVVKLDDLRGIDNDNSENISEINKKSTSGFELNLQTHSTLQESSKQIVQLTDGNKSVLYSDNQDNAVLQKSKKTVGKPNISCEIKSGTGFASEINSEGCIVGVDSDSTDENALGHDNLLISPTSEAFSSASFSHHEASITTVHNTLFGKCHINPVPDDFCMAQENKLYDYNVCAPATCDSFILSDNSVVISNSNALPRTESVVSSNYSLSQLKAYGSDESLNEEPPAEIQQCREGKIQVDVSDKDSDSDSSSTSSSTSILISDSSDSESDYEYANFTPKLSQPVKVKGELDIKDLPPIQDLKISVPEEECLPVGKIFQVVDQLVVVQSLKDTPALDLDTVLFMQGGQPLGEIFDVFGPVTEPYYCVRFNSSEHIKEKNINLNQMVYCAPKTNYTNYVFVAQLMKLKGSDASWENDIEPPEIYLEYSDDEQEQIAKKKKSKSKKAVFTVDLDPDEPARKRHFAYEKRMNERNLQLSAVKNHQSSNNGAHNVKNVLWPPLMPQGASSHSNNTRFPGFQRVCHQIFGRPPMFNTRVPPPNISFSLPVRLGLPNIQNSGKDSPNLLQGPPPNFASPNNYLHFPRAAPCVSGNSELPHNTGIQHRTFIANQMPTPHRLPGNHGLQSYPNWRQSFQTCENAWANTSPHRDISCVNNNLLPTSPFWVQRPPPAPSPNAQGPFSAFPDRSYLPPPRPPQNLWPTQSPQSTGLHPPNNFSEINFNPCVPPPTPNPFKY